VASFYFIDSFRLEVISLFQGMSETYEKAIGIVTVLAQRQISIIVTSKTELIFEVL
jgi:hypothetical protein